MNLPIYYCSGVPKGGGLPKTPPPRIEKSGKTPPLESKSRTPPPLSRRAKRGGLYFGFFSGFLGFFRVILGF